MTWRLIRRGDRRAVICRGGALTTAAGPSLHLQGVQARHALRGTNHYHDMQGKETTSPSVVVSPLRPHCLTRVILATGAVWQPSWQSYVGALRNLLIVEQRNLFLLMI